MDADSQSALFGDTVSPSDAASATSSSAPPDLASTSSVDDSASDSSSFGQETTFGDDSDFVDQSTFSSETTFTDDFDSSSFGDQPQGGGDMFDDSTIEGLGSAGEEAAEQGSSVLSFIWDLVTGGDD